MEGPKFLQLIKLKRQLPMAGPSAIWEVLLKPSKIRPSAEEISSSFKIEPTPKVFQNKKCLLTWLTFELKGKTNSCFQAPGLNIIFTDAICARVLIVKVLEF